MNKKSTRTEKILGFLCYTSMLLPFIFLNKHHSCNDSDECFMVWHDGELGVCVERAIDEACMTIAFLWCFIMFCSVLVLGKNKNNISPFVVIVIVFAFALFLAFIDPSKWKFTIALFVSMASFVIAAIYDKKTNNITQI